MTRQKSVEADSPADWSSFFSAPARYATAERLAACFDGAISEAACRRMLENDRLEERLSALLGQRYGFSLSADIAEDNETDRTIALMKADELQALSRYTGAVFWGNYLAGAILGRDAAVLHGLLGEELCQFAVANRDLAAPLQSLAEVETILERVEDDGRRCLAAWCFAQPPEIGSRVRLKLPVNSLADEPPRPPFSDVGPTMVRRAAAREGAE